ncbi:MAG: hypothetical protein WCJ35_03165 [Planctomycetota bacterium]
MNARPRSPANSDRHGQVVKHREYETLYCTEEEQLEAALESGHLSTQQMFAYGKHASASRIWPKRKQARQRKVEHHLAKCKHCLRDFSGIAEILIEDRSSTAADRSQVSRLNVKNGGPPLKLLAVVRLPPRQESSAGYDVPDDPPLSMIYGGDRELKIRMQERRATFRLDIYHARFPPGTMLRVQYEEPGQNRVIRSHYLVLRKEPFQTEVQGDVLLDKSAVEGANPQEFSLEFVASACVIQEADAKSLRRSFERAFSKDASISSDRTVILAAWRNWAERALEERALNGTIQGLAEEIYQQCIHAASNTFDEQKENIPPCKRN